MTIQNRISLKTVTIPDPPATESPANSSSETSSNKATRNVDILQSLRQRMIDCESLHRSNHNAIASSGSAALDALLPGGGFRSGQIVEWLTAESGSGAAMWGMNAAINSLNTDSLTTKGISRNLTNSSESQSIAVIDNDQMFYPPAAASLGLDLQQLLVIQPRNHADAIWAIDQTLRCPRIAAVWADIQRLNAKEARRLQLAAEEGDTLGMFIRPLTARNQPSWADIQIQVEPLPTPDKPAPTNLNASLTQHFSRRRWKLTLLRCRGMHPGSTVTT